MAGNPKRPRLSANGSVNGFTEENHRTPLCKDNAIKMRNKLICKATQIHYPENPLKIDYAIGQYMYDEQGKKYLDCINNVAHVGHCHPHVVEAGQHQMAKLETNNRFLNDEMLIYAQRLTALLPEKLSVCFFVCTGTEANDLALRLARTYTKHNDVLVLDRAYHGHSVAMIDISPYKFKRLNHTADFVHVCPCPDTYRGLHSGKDNALMGERYTEEVKKIITEATNKGRKIAAFYAESLQSCGGQIIYPDGFLVNAFKEVRNAGGICIADEVQVGFGRVGRKFWGFELHGVVPDIVTVGKPMGDGHPISAVITTQEIADAFAETKVPYFNTFGGNPVSCSIANAVLDVIEKEKLQEHAKDLGDYWLKRLIDLQEDHPLIGDVRGVGLFIGIELVHDRVTKEPASEIAKRVIYSLREKGILLSADGPDVNVLKIKPPLVITKEDVDHFMGTFVETLQSLGH